MSSVKKLHSVKLPYLYKEAGKVLKAYSEKKGSLKTLVYSTHCSQLYSRLFAVVYRVDQHWAQLDAVLKETRLLEENSKLNPFVARVLITELLWGSGQLQSEARPVLTVRACADSLRAAAANPLLPSVDAGCKPPRYARVNTLKASLEDVLQELANDGWKRVSFSCGDYDSFISDVKSLSEYEFLLDFHVGDLLVFSAGTNLVQSRLYTRRWLVLQDKASCLPALLMQPSEGDYIIDACAAPGMKTSHMAALMHNTGTLVAVERDGQRLKTLNTLLSELGVQNCRTMCADFMRVDPGEHSRCTAILLDPSCSGTGMLDRPTDESGPDAQRLLRLSNLQGMLLRHALSFPSVERVVYSTCSTTVQENEQVVAEALSNHPHWQLATVAPAIWRAFGKPEYPFWQRCMRTETREDLCCGFFVAVFHRRTAGGVTQRFDATDDISSTVETPDSRSKGSSNRKRKRKVAD